MFGKRWNSDRLRLQESVLLGNKIESVFRELYEGECTFRSCILKLRTYLDNLVWMGVLSYRTACRIVKFLTMDDHLRIISEGNEWVSLGETALDEEDNTKLTTKIRDEFLLSDLMEWFAYELAHDDQCMGRVLSDKSYTGIKAYLNNLEVEWKMEEVLFRYKDFVPYGKDHVFFTKDDPQSESCCLYIKSLHDDYGNGALICNDISADGRIYWTRDSDYLAVNCTSERVAVIDLADGFKHSIAGIVYGVSGNNAILNQDGCLYPLNMENMQKKLLHKKLLPPGYVTVTEEGIAIRSFESDICNEVRYLTRKRVRNNKLFDRMAGWAFLIDRCFDMTDINLTSSIKNRLFLFRIYTVPLPLSLEAVKKSFQEAFRYVLEGKIKMRRAFVTFTKVMNDLESTECTQDTIWDALKKSGVTAALSGKEPAENYILWEAPYIKYFESVDCNMDMEELFRFKVEDDDDDDDMEDTEGESFSGLFGGLGRGIDLDKMMADIDKKIAELEAQEKKMRGEKDEEE